MRSFPAAGALRVCSVTPRALRPRSEGSERSQAGRGKTGLGGQVGYGGAATQLSSFKTQQGPSGKQSQRCWVLGKARHACACRSVRLSLCGLAVLLVSLKGSGSSL